MKKFTLTCLAVISAILLFAQAPQLFKYQAVARDNAGNILSEQPVSFRISILMGYIGGPSVYVETHTDTTNQFGLVNLEIGNGTIESGVFEEIGWGDYPYYLKIEITENGGITYQLMGTSQLLSVPYSLYSESTGDAGATEIDDLIDGRTLGNSVFLGSGAGNNDDGSANNNTAIGINALTSNTSGWGNTANGYAALYSSETRFRNTAIGYRALYSSTFGDYNTASGSEALYSNTTGDANTAVGDGALYSNTSGIRNAGFGFSANWNNQEGSQNTIIGFQAGYGTGLHNKSGNIFLGYRAGYNEMGDDKLYIENSSSSSPLIYGNFEYDSVRINGVLEVTGSLIGDIGINSLYDGKTGGNSVFLGSGAGDNDDGTDNYNVAVGDSALYTNMSGSYNTAYGYRALLSNTGSFNTAIGYNALYFNTSAGYITAIGNRALYYNTTGDNITAIGSNALYHNTTGDYNTANGTSALYSNTVGHDNTANGSGALSLNTTGDYNTAIGRRALGTNLSGDYNTGIGYQANYYNKNGSRNTIIGYEAGMGWLSDFKSGSVFLGYQAGYNETENNKLYIENSNSTTPLIGGDFSADEIYLNGNVGIGTADPKAGLHVSDTNGVLFTGTYGEGEIPIEGVGTRMMWYPGKAAFRAGRVTESTYWAADSIGDYSFATGLNTSARSIASTAMGQNTTASGNYSTALGQDTEASGSSSLAMGYNTIASGDYSTAKGRLTEASGNTSTAMGYGTTASGRYSTATGLSTEAGGDYSTAMGSFVTAQEDGAFAIGDHSTSTITTFTIANTFNARFANGYRLYTVSGSPWIGASLLAGQNSWTTMSDSTKKENIQPVNSEEILTKIGQFKLGTWNYKGQDAAKFRHYGPMSQDFYAAFGHDGIGTIGCDTLLSSADFDGINFIAIQALEKRTSKLQTENEKLKEELAVLKSEMERFEFLVQKLEDLSAINKK
jgi:hypothetical protein